MSETVFPLLKTCGYSVCVYCMRDAFANEQIEKRQADGSTMMQFQIALGIISLNKMVRHTSEL